MASVTQLTEAVAPSQTENVAEVPRKKSKGHRCYFCGQKFMDKNVLRKHISIHKDRDFYCEVCNKAFSAAWGLRKHMKTHTGERPYQCEHCDRAFVQKCTLQFHIKAIHGNKPHPKCKTCGKRLKSFSYSQCWLCRYEGKEVVDGNNQLQQIEEYSSDKLDTQTVEFVDLDSSLCREAEAVDIMAMNTVINDLTLEKVEESAVLTCEMCNKECTDLAQLKQHQEDHGHQQLLSCDHCDLKFTDSLALKRHLITHTDLRPFICQKCGKDFKRDYNLRQHMITHKVDRPYICKICKSAFKSVPTLKQHLVSHSSDRPFICKDCGSGFKSSQGLRTHVVIHYKSAWWLEVACPPCKPKVGLGLQGELLL
ncbi:zinc finger protein 91 [Trichonephila clavipes]|nr:zinc finger protein 91 [Trichonephila clavipes]